MDAPTSNARSPLGEVLLVFTGVTLLTVAVTWLASVLPGLDGYVHLLVGTVFLVTAVHLARRESDQAGGRGVEDGAKVGLARFGIDLAGLLEAQEGDGNEGPAGPLGLFELGRALRRALPSAVREAAAALAVAAVVFPPFVVAFYVYHAPTHPFAWRAPEDLASFALTQLLVVALPEEALFRGYVQTRLSDRWPPTTRLLGVPLDLRVLLLQAALFAVLHFASIPHPARLAVFFPALLFGWMRAWRGGIGAAMLLHALSNLLAEVLVQGWLT
jgi:membrane protease YdiL (CAAX protease family)